MDHVIPAVGGKTAPTAEVTFKWTVLALTWKQNESTNPRRALKQSKTAMSSGLWLLKNIAVVCVYQDSKYDHI